MSLAPGVRLGAYEVVALIGAGGMGEVYRARDTRLHRDVAIKVLPEAFVHDADRLARFKREAQVLASLNYPHIAAIYGLEETATGSALILELVEGPTLADVIAGSAEPRTGAIDGRYQDPDRKRRLAAGMGARAIPIDEALPIARQVADALEAAHEHGVIHRDLKPGNIKLTADGTVKVLDFGLAKATNENSGTVRLPDVTASPTITSPAMTLAGVILGTAAYMSPEQAKGKPADKRSDIWAFGCVLYEMLTGKRAFEGEDVSDTLAAVLRGEPDWTALPSATPVALRKLLRRALEKDRKRRLADIADARLEIDEAAVAGPPPPAGIQRLHLWQRPVPALFAAIILMAVGGLAVWSRTPAIALPRQAFTISVPNGVAYPDSNGAFAVSPDGTMLVFPAVDRGGERRLYARPINRIEVEPIRGSEGAYGPFFSPDGEWIAFFTDPGAVRGALKKIPRHGGQAIPIVSAPTPAGGVWLKDDTIVFASGARVGGGLKRVSAAGGDAVELTKFGASEGQHAWPDILPDGDTVIFSVRSSAQRAGRIAAVSLKTGDVRTVVESGFYGRYVPFGHLVYTQDGTLMAAPFDAGRVRTMGPAVPVVQNVRVERGVFPGPGFAVSSFGFLIHANPSADDSQQHILVWVDHFGREEPLGAPPRRYASARLSPDGTRIALDVRQDENDIWVWSLDRATLTPVTAGPDLERFPIWSPDGKRVLFGSPRNNRTDNVYSQAPDGTGAIERLTTNESAQQYPQTFSPDGSLLFTEWTAEGTNLQLRSKAGDTRLVFRTPYRISSAELSPDGRVLAYASNDTGRTEVYVRPFPDIEDQRVLISTGGGFRPVWSPNGGELFYLVGTSPDPVSVMSASVESRKPIKMSAPRKLIEGAFESSAANTMRTFDVSPDGKRFLMIKSTNPASGDTQRASLTVLVNWFEELKRVAPITK